MATDAVTGRRLLDFELGLARRTCDEVVEANWGTAFLAPSLPQVWDASWLAVEETGLSAEELIALGDRLLGEAGFAHRTILLCDEADGARVGAELEALPGWEVERLHYMTHDDGIGRGPSTPVTELELAETLDLRRHLIREWLPDDEQRDATVEQLLERNRRLCEVAGDRWFVASAEDEQASTCCLLAGEVIAQVEDVGTLERARGRGLAQSVVLAALAEAHALGPDLIFLVADADDWPLSMYTKLGFKTVSELYIMRRTP